MAGGQERVLRRRIRSVQSTKKITRAMELIAASRIVKAQARVAAAVPYADRITDVARHLQESGGSSHPLLSPRPEIRAVALVVIGADRGLCGGYNSSVIRAAEAEIREHARAGHDYALVTAGRKVEGGDTGGGRRHGHKAALPPAILAAGEEACDQIIPVRDGREQRPHVLALAFGRGDALAQGHLSDNSVACSPRARLRIT